MKKSDILSRKRVNFAISNSDKNLLKLYQENKKLLEEVKDIKKKYNLTDEDFVKLVKKHIPIPISIFKNNSPLEALVKYLKENINLSLSEISRLLNRDQRTIWITYHNSKKSIKEIDASSKVAIPLDYFSERELSILENLVDYLIEQKFSLSKISERLERDYKTIYTIYTRMKKKDAEH